MIETKRLTKNYGNLAALVDLDLVIEAGYEDQIIIGSDTGWYDPGFPPGFVVEPYDQIMESFIPDMRDAGYSEELITKLLHDNPWEAYSR